MIQGIFQLKGMFQLKRAVPLVAALVFLGGGGAATSSAAGAPSAPAGPNAVVQLELENGLRILVLPDSATPMISAGLDGLTDVNHCPVATLSPLMISGRLFPNSPRT